MSKRIRRGFYKGGLYRVQGLGSKLFKGGYIRDCIGEYDRVYSWGYLDQVIGE